MVSLWFVVNVSYARSFPQASLASRKAELNSKPFSSFSVGDMQIAFYACGLQFDDAAMQTNQAGGELMLQVTSESELFDILGVKKMGNSVRVLRLIRHLEAGKGLPAFVDINETGDDEFPSSWSVAQVAAAVTQDATLKGVGPLITEHLIAGDVLADLNIEVLLALLSLTVPVRLTLKKKLIALQKAAVEVKDAIVVERPRLLRFLCC